MHHLHQTRLTGLLADSAQLPPPLSAVAFTLLTGLLSPPELWHPATRVGAGQLVVAAGPRRRCVPLPSATAAVLGGTDGALRSLLHIDHASGWQPSELRAELEDRWPDAPSLEQLAMAAMHDLVACADGAAGRSAVLAYAGLGAASASGGATVEAARLVDKVVCAAGFALIEAA